MESFNGHFKGPMTSEFHEASSLETLRATIQERVEYWNHERRHSALDYQAPATYLAQQGHEYATQ